MIIINQRDLTNFIDRVQGIHHYNGLDGCWYIKLTDSSTPKYLPLCLVFADSDEDGLVCKIAYNSDDLQCDYDWDWTEPFDLETGDYIGFDDVHCEDAHANQLADTILYATNIILNSWK